MNPSVSLYSKWNYQNPIRIDKNAKIVSHRNVENIRVIEVKNSFYRNAGPIDGIFEVDFNNPDVKNIKGKLKVLTVFGWYGQIVNRGCHELDISQATYKFRDNYFGEVVDNIENANGK